MLCTDLLLIRQSLLKLHQPPLKLPVRPLLKHCHSPYNLQHTILLQLQSAPSNLTACCHCATDETAYCCNPHRFSIDFSIEHILCYRRAGRTNYHAYSAAVFHGLYTPCLSTVRCCFIDITLSYVSHRFSLWMKVCPACQRSFQPWHCRRPRMFHGCPHHNLL